MTVGIAAICNPPEGEENPHVIATADRMVTHGAQGGIEYEDTESKIEVYLISDKLTGIAIGSGMTGFIQGVLDEVYAALPNVSSDLDTERDVAEVLLAGYQKKVQKIIENQILSPMGFELSDLRDPNMEVPPNIQSAFEQRASEFRGEVDGSVSFIAATAGPDGVGVYTITGSEIFNHSSQGYTVVGSGSDSATLTFIRRNYSRNCPHNEALFTVMEAKAQSEERQGVGQKMDIVEVRAGNVNQYDDDEIKTLREKLEEIEDAERQARQDIITGWN